MGAKCMTSFTYVRLPLVSDYSRVLSTQKDLIVSIYPSLVVTREYNSARQELLASIFNSSAIARKQCTSCAAQAQHMSYLQIFSRHEVLLAFFCKLECELYCTYVM